MELRKIMDKKKFNFWNRIVGVAVFVAAAVTYLSTIEPSSPFWDCGEFTASSYKLEVGHPPGNPTFQLFARFCSMFTGAENAAVAVNAMSAVCSALTIFLLYLTIVFLIKRFVKPSEEGTYSLGQTISIMGGAAVGALAYTFSDTFWFSAVESEVYAMSSLFTALVVWSMTKWYEQADEPYANRWIVFICFLIGLSIGIHLLNLLAIPAILFMYYYRRHEAGYYNWKQFVGIFILSAVIVWFLFFILFPYFPKLAAYCDLLFVNVFGLPYNSGAAFFLLAVLFLCLWGSFKTYKKGKVFLNTALLGLTTIIVGFSLFAIVVIRSNVMPPTNEYQPDNAFTLVRYLSREQYGSSPLVYGQYFDAPADIKYGKYWTPIGKKYKHVKGPAEAVYDASGKMLFPRMWCNTSDNYIDFYESYMNGKGIPVPGADHKKPTFGTNMKFFIDYQLNWMYWRYFMWNFVGRQNDVHSPTPGELFYGNWESGVKFIDNARLGDQSDAPAILSRNKGKNHYFFLPLILGLIGLFFQFDKDKRGWWIVFLLFFMTGIAIVIYLNQQPFQVRERDYAYAGSFYAFSMWIGMAVPALYALVRRLLKGQDSALSAGLLTVACLCVPTLMASQNWDDHDRSNRATAVEMAKNYLNSVGPDGILITHGDNDTFPLWYAQEIESVRTDVRIVNTSLLGTDWHIEQMKYAVNESAPLPLTVGHEQYLYGTNDFVTIYDTRDQVIPISDVMAVFKHPKAKLQLQDGRMLDYIMSRKIAVPVNKENALKSGIVPPQYADLIQDTIVLEMPKDKHYVTKQELFILDLLDGYQWDRPLNMLSQGGDINIGLKSYLMYEVFSCKLVPFKNRVTSSNLGLVDADDIYHKMTEVFSWDALSRTDYYADYQNMYTFLGVTPQREIFLNTARIMRENGDIEKALELLDKGVASLPSVQFPLESVAIGFYANDVYLLDIIEEYYICGAPMKARALAEEFSAELLQSALFYFEFYEYASEDFKRIYNMIFYLADELDQYGDGELGMRLKGTVNYLIHGGESEEETPTDGTEEG